MRLICDRSAVGARRGYHPWVRSATHGYPLRCLRHQIQAMPSVFRCLDRGGVKLTTSGFLASSKVVRKDEPSWVMNTSC